MKAGRRSQIQILIAVAAGLPLLASGCSDPSIQGPKRMAVGTKVEVEVAQGPELVQGDFQLVDAEGRTYGFDDPLVEYLFTDSRHISFRIPPGIATGSAKVSLGTDGKDGYTLKLTIVRLSVLLDPDGWLRAVDVDTGLMENTFLLGHGPFSMRISKDGSRVLATAGGDDGVHFLHLGAGGLTPYAPSVDGIGTQPVDAVFMSSGALVAMQEGLAVVRQHQNGSTVLEGFLDTGPVNGLAGSQEAGRVVALALATTDGTDVADYLHGVEFPDDEPVLAAQPIRLDPVELGWEPQADWQSFTVGAWASPVLSSDGRFLFLSNRGDNRVVVMSPVNGVLADFEVLPVEGEIQNADPVRLGLSFDDRKLVVLCGESATAVVYGVDDTGGLQYEGTKVLGGIPWDVGFTTGGFAYVLADSGVVLLNLSDPAAEPTVLDWEPAQGAVGIGVQP